MSANSKPLKVYIPHLESEFVTNACTLAELLDEAIRNGLPSTNRKSVNVFWKDKDDDDVCIYNQKSFETFLRMPERTIWIKFPQEEHALKITLEINGVGHIIYSFARSYQLLLEDLDGLFDIRFPNDDYVICYKDHDKNEVCIDNGKSFEIFRRSQKRNIWIKRYQEDPLRIIVEIDGAQYLAYSFANTYERLLEDLDCFFGTRFPNDEYRIYHNGESIICNQRTFEMFLETNKMNFTNPTTSLGKTLLVKRMKYDLDIQFQIDEESHMIRSRARSYQQLIEDINGLFGISFLNEEYHIIFEKDHDKMVICNQKMFAEFLGGVSLKPRKINIQKAESVFKIIHGTNKSTLGFSAAVSYDKLMVNLVNMMGKQPDPWKEYSIAWRYTSEEMIEITNANFIVFFKYGSKQLELYVDNAKNYKAYPIKVLYGTRRYIINPVDDYDDFLKELRMNCGVNTDNLQISYTYNDEKLEPHKGHIENRTTFENFKTRLNFDASPKIMHTIVI